MTDFLLRSALDYLEHGFAPVLLKENSKVPFMCGWQEKRLTRAELTYWLTRNRLNVGVLLGRQTGVAVLDKEGRRAARTTAFLNEHKAKSPMVVLTPSGGYHEYFRIPDTLKETKTKIAFLGLDLDVKLSGAVCGRGSVIDGKTYRLKSGKRMVHKDELPFLPDSLVSLLNEAAPKPALMPNTTARAGMFSSRSPIKNPKAYCLKIHSIQGQNGSAGLVRAVAVLRDAGMPAQDAFSFLVSEWNREPRVTPPWTEAEILHAVKRHFRSEQ